MCVRQSQTFKIPHYCLTLSTSLHLGFSRPLIELVEHDGAIGVLVSWHAVLGNEEMQPVGELPLSYSSGIVLRDSVKMGFFLSLQLNHIKGSIWLQIGQWLIDRVHTELFLTGEYNYVVIGVEKVKGHFLAFNGELLRGCECFLLEFLEHLNKRRSYHFTVFDLCAVNKRVDGQQILFVVESFRSYEVVVPPSIGAIGIILINPLPFTIFFFQFRRPNYVLVYYGLAQLAQTVPLGMAGFATVGEVAVLNTKNRDVINFLLLLKLALFHLYLHLALWITSFSWKNICELLGALRVRGLVKYPFMRFPVSVRLRPAGWRRVFILHILLCC